MSDAIPVGSLSGGTDLCTGFLGPSPLVPVWEGEISCRMLGARVEAFGPDGHPVIGREGELVITAPMPSMPVGLWGDDDGSRLRAAYFEPWPGVWRHGDWLTITERGSCIISGRSDATLNRGGVRLGTAEFYAVVEALPDVADSLVVHLEDAVAAPASCCCSSCCVTGRPSTTRAVRRSGRPSESSCPRAMSPTRSRAVGVIPRTLSGKKLEVPVKRILPGHGPRRRGVEGRPRGSWSLEPFEAWPRSEATGTAPMSPVAVRAAVGSDGRHPDTLDRRTGMDQLFAVSFDTEEAAVAAMRSLRGLEHEGKIHFEDTAIITRDPDGTPHVKNELSAATETGAAIGGGIGLLVAGIIFPVIGVAIGAAAGAAIGALTHKGVEGRFVEDVKAELQPGRSALLLVTQQVDEGLLIAALRPYSGTIIDTTLDGEARKALEEALR